MVDFRPVQARRLIFVGTIRNCAVHLPKIVDQLLKIAPPDVEISFFIVESDSTDNSLAVLTDMAKKIDNFRFISLGSPSLKIPSRVARICYCRNVYLEYLSSIAKKDGASEVKNTGVAIMDFDEVNLDITIDFNKVFTFLGAKKIATASQRRYYDLYALRHKYLCPNDVFREREVLEVLSSKLIAHYKTVLLRQFRMPTTFAPIIVNSAFGGLAFYPLNCFGHNILYSTDKYGDGGYTCEHVNFNRRLSSRNYSIYIVDFIRNGSRNKHLILYKFNVFFYLLIYSFADN